MQGARIGSMEDEVMKAIEKAFEVNSCNKCCDILRKLKDSIMRFRKCLEGESDEF